MASHLGSLEAFETALFGDKARAAAQTAGHNTLKASLFTLIILVKDLEHTVFAQDLVRLIAKKLPCKIIFVSADPANQSNVIEKESSCRTIGDSQSNVLCDVSFIHVGTNQAAAIPFLVLPEIIPDLPVFLLIEHDPIDFQNIISQIEPYVHRIIVDIPHLYNVGQFAEHLLSMKQREKFVGLNWVRTKPWRDAFVHVFHSEELVQRLSKAKRIEIRFAHNPESRKTVLPDTQAIMFQSWLASRFNWRPARLQESPDSIHLTYATDSREIDILLVPTTSVLLESGNIASIEINAEDEVHYLLSYEHDDKNIVVHASSQDRCEMPSSLFVGSYQKGRQLPKEIFQQKISAHYIPTLEIMASRIWQQDRESVMRQAGLRNPT